MYSPLVILTICYIAGVLLGSFFHLGTSLSLLLVGAAFLAAVAGYLFAWQKNLPVILVLFILLGTAMSGMALEQSKTVLTEYAGSRVMLTGRILTDADIRSDKVFYLLQVQEVSVDEDVRAVTGLVRLQTVEVDRIYCYGDIVRVSGLLSRPELPGNPGAFNYRTYLERQGISAIMLTKGNEAIEKVSSNPANPFFKMALDIKHKLAAAATASLESNQAAVLNGIVFGTQGMIDRQTREAFTETGVVHILSVSGLHIGLVAGGLLGLLRLLRSPPKFTAPLLTPAIVFYVFMTGFNPAVLRAAIMAIFLLWAHQLGRHRDWPTTMALAALLILLWNPLQIYHPGFQLSFAATWGLLYLTPFFNNVCAGLVKSLPDDWGRLLILSVAIPLAAQLATIPLVAWYYNMITPVSLVANLVAVPLVSLILLLGFTAAFLGLIWLPLAEIINVSNGIIIDAFLYIISYFQKLPGAVFYLPTPPEVLAVAWYGVLTVIVWLHSENLAEPIKKRMQSWLVIGLACCFTLFIWTAWSGGDELAVHFIDVGQGDCILVQTPRGKNMLIDTGGRRGEFETGTGTGDQVVTPYLRRIGVGRIDVLVLTHPHEDHAGGAAAVVKNFPVGMVVASAVDETQGLLSEQEQGNEEVSAFYLGLLKKLTEDGVTVNYAGSGDLIKLDRETEALVLSPEIKGNKEYTNLNDLSLVLKLTYRQKAFLFTGDIELDAQTGLLLRSGEDLQVNVLMMPHHGSRFLLPDLLDKANPDTAVISVGANNSFGHPAKAVLDSLNERQIGIYRTDRDGAVIFRTNGIQISAETGKKR